VPLILTGQPPIHWAIAGAGIGVITLLLLFATSHRLGISTGFEDRPILVNIGEGKVYALAALLGASLFPSGYRRLRIPLRLPELNLGTGDG